MTTKKTEKKKPTRKSKKKSTEFQPVKMNSDELHKWLAQEKGLENIQLRIANAKLMLDKATRIYQDEVGKHTRDIEELRREFANKQVVYTDSLNIIARKFKIEPEFMAINEDSGVISQLGDMKKK